MSLTKNLAIFTIINAVKEQLSQHNKLILQAPPGAGKSTVLPIELLEQPWLATKKIVMLEPRRLAARSVANRMATLLNENVGETIGYRIRFENCTSPKTRIEVITEGLLTRMLQRDNTLDEVGLLIFDEFHERSLHADLALALSLQVQQLVRSDLKILLMSATMETTKLSELLEKAPILSCEGRQYPITIHYSSMDTNEPLPVSTAKAIQKAIRENTGDLLVFLPGSGEIHRTQQLLEEGGINASIHPLYGDLSIRKQQEAITPLSSGKRKIVLATSIAETSLTIEGISIVIDSGYTKALRFDPRTGLSRLETLRITKDAANQRAGRAGRLGPGICYRLWTKEIQSYLHEQRKPEIADADLSPLLLELSAWGVKNANELCWPTPPPPSSLKQAQEVLQQLGAIVDHKISQHGREILRLPTHPRLAHMLVKAQHFAKENNEQANKWLALAIDITALLEERDILLKDAGANLTLRLEILRKWRMKEKVNADHHRLERIDRIVFSWRKMLDSQIDRSIVQEKEVGRLIATAYPERIAKQIHKGSHRYRLANGRIGQLSPHDPLGEEEWLAIAHIDAGNNEGKIFVAAPLNPKDILHLAKEKNSIKWNTEKGMIEAFQETHIGSISISLQPLERIEDGQRISILCQAIREEGLAILNWTDEITQWQARISSLKTWRPNEKWPNVSNENLLATLEEWLAPYLTGISKQMELAKLDVETILTGFLSWELQQQVERLAPSKIKVPSGSLIKLTYFSNGNMPEMAVRLQELFGLAETPTVNEGRTKVLLHLLSPAYRPVQLTQDLKSFWNTTYAEVRKELRMRYPKHSWPEDPWTAEAVRGVKKRK